MIKANQAERLGHITTDLILLRKRYGCRVLALSSDKPPRALSLEWTALGEAFYIEHTIPDYADTKAMPQSGV